MTTCLMGSVLSADPQPGGTGAKTEDNASAFWSYDLHLTCIKSKAGEGDSNQ